MTWNGHEINLHLRFNWDRNSIDVCAIQSWCLMPLSKIFQLYRGGGSRSVREKKKSTLTYVTKTLIHILFDSK